MDTSFCASVQFFQQLDLNLLNLEQAGCIAAAGGDRFFRAKCRISSSL